MSGWVEIDSKNLLEPVEEYSRCQHYFTTRWKNIKPLNEIDIVPPIVTLSFDLECYSVDPTVFPDPDIAENEIIQIGSGFNKFGKSEVLRHVLVLRDCDLVENCIIEVCQTEEELIEKCHEEEKSRNFKFPSS